MIKPNIVSKEILEQIYLAKTLVEKDPRFDLIRKQRIYHGFRAEANKHSVEIELPNGHKVKRGRARKIALDNLVLAEQFLSNHFGGEFTNEQLIVAATLINGAKDKLAYRDITARANNGEEYFIYPDNVPEEMLNFFAESKMLPNPVEKAIHAHFQVARIHPFEDCNGRLARLLQNVVLDKNNLPPVMIEPFERKDYIDLISRAARSYRENGNLIKPALSQFYNYLALKIRDSLVKVRKRLD